jgi:3',5'-cyclic AMP phosphodiesterase CpdA
MSLILHLSDLHLGAAGTSDDVGDYKVRVIPEGERQTRVKLLGQTLDALRKYLTTQHEVLDAVVVTGDVTTYCNPTGFTELQPLLTRLGGTLPPPDRIVVIPGNHDVAWGTPPSSTERYRAFIGGIRGAGYVTPLLDGVDYQGGLPKRGARPLVIGSDFLIVAMNSADMCGVIEPLSYKAERSLAKLRADGKLPTELASEIKRLRMVDMPRVSQYQLGALATVVESTIGSATPLVKIAAIHHQLAPVRAEEEVKAFESLVNLGEVRTFFADAGIDVLLHGHKHVDRVTTDVFTPYGAGSRPEHRLIVCSCGTVGGMTATNHEIAKLVRIQSDLPKLRRVQIESVRAVSAGASLKNHIELVFSAPTGRPAAKTPVVTLSGQTVGDVHELILDLAQQKGGAVVTDLICTVEDGSSASHPPTTYPTVQTPYANAEAWFEATVQWWQDDRLEEGKPFTHGQRIRNWPGRFDQFTAMIDALGSDPGTSRAIAVLVNPATDILPNKALQFPSFALLQLRIIDDRLHCTAVFRKQEMRYWWAINAAEVAMLQAEAVDRLRDRLDRLTPGPLRTFTSEAVFSNAIPKVDVPKIDRLAWTDPIRIWTMAVAVADADMSARDEELKQLRVLMDDWRPTADTPPRDGAAVPVRGLMIVAQALEAISSRYPESNAALVAELTRQMHDANVSYAQGDTSEKPIEAYRQWRSRQIRRLDSFNTLLTEPESRKPHLRKHAKPRRNSR